MNSLQSPPAFHIAVTLPIVAAADNFLEDLVLCVEAEKDKDRERLAMGKSKKGPPGGDAAAVSFFPFTFSLLLSLFLSFFLMSHCRRG